MELRIRPTLKGVNPKAVLPYGVTGEHVFMALVEFFDFLEAFSGSLIARDLPTLESTVCVSFRARVGHSPTRLTIFTVRPRFTPAT
jgi:hypothetical protein